MAALLARSLAVALTAGATAHPAAAVPADATEPPSDVEEIIVRGRGFGELRFQIQLAEQTVYDRFNAINSDDRFDIVCEATTRWGSRIEERVCASNSWRMYDARFAGATARLIGGEPGANPQQFFAQRMRDQRLLRAEMRELAFRDEELNAAVMQLGRAYQTLAEATGARPRWSFAREVPTTEALAAADVEHTYEVAIGAEPWSVPLTGRSFTFAGVTGEIQRVELECENSERRLNYHEAVDWTVPESWGACTLRVDAKRDTTFVLYQFN